jgi:hypothetical protein
MNEMSITGTHATPVRDIVITKLSVVAFFLRTAIGATILFGFWYAALHPDGTAPKQVFENRMWWTFALLLTPVLLWFSWTVLRQMIFHQRRAVWVEDGWLKFIDDTGYGRRFRSIEIANIRELSLDRVYDGRNPWGYPGIAIKMSDGRVAAYIMTLFFTDSAPVVCMRLTEVLSLPKTPDRD